MYAKMKELGPVGGRAPGTPPDPPMLLHIFYLLFGTGHVPGHLNFHGIAGIAIKPFDIVFMFVTSLSIVWIRSLSPAWY